MKDKEIYKLSEQFEKTVSEPDLELIVTVLNINEGRNTRLMQACKTLKEYSIFVSLVRKYIKEIPKDTEDRNAGVRASISAAIDQCISDGILADFFSLHKTEVVEMSMWDYNEQLHNKTLHNEGYEEGYKSGSGETQMNIFKTMLLKGYSEEEAMAITGVTRKQLADIK